MERLFSIAPDENSWWLAHLSKGEEVRVEMESVAKTLASVNYPDAGSESTRRWLHASGRIDKMA